MEDSNIFETADDSAIDTSGENVCDSAASDGGDFEEGGYIESKAPDFDDGDDEGDDDTPFSGSQDKPVFSKKIMDYLDELTEKDEDAKKPAAAPAERPRMPRTPQEEDAALINSIPSERGRERMRNIIGAKNEAEGRYRQNQGVINNIRNFVEKVGVDTEGLVQNLEYSRLLGKGDEDSLRVALDMLEEQREMICKRLNEERPGIDLLSDFPELKEAVKRREISPQHAAKLARYERKEKENQRQVERRHAYDQESATFLYGLDRTKNAITAYLQTRSKEADHNFKVRRLHEHLSRPGVLQELTKNLDSKRWFSQIKFMYDNIVVPPARPQPRMQPIRSRPTMQGPVRSKPNATMRERMSDILDSMGI